MSNNTFTSASGKTITIDTSEYVSRSGGEPRRLVQAMWSFEYDVSFCSSEAFIPRPCSTYESAVQQLLFRFRSVRQDITFTLRVRDWR